MFARIARRVSSVLALPMSIAVSLGAAPAASAAPVEGGHTQMCSPYPPDYPGCSPKQLRALHAALFQKEFEATAYNPHYLRIGMGQHHQPVIHVATALDRHLEGVYDGAVRAYERNHHGDSPKYTDWQDFKQHTRYICSGPTIEASTPAAYCAGWSWFGNHVNDLLAEVHKVALGCGGTVATFGLGGLGSGLAAMELFDIGEGAWQAGKFGVSGGLTNCVMDGAHALEPIFHPLWDMAQDWWNSLEPKHAGPHIDR